MWISDPTKGNEEHEDDGQLIKCIPSDLDLPTMTQSQIWRLTGRSFSGIPAS